MRRMIMPSKLSVLALMVLFTALKSSTAFAPSSHIRLSHRPFTENNFPLVVTSTKNRKSVRFASDLSSVPEPEKKGFIQKVSCNILSS